MWDLATAKQNSHVFSETLDVVAFTVPILAAIVIAPFAYFFIPHDVIPLWAYIVIVVLTDVGHVWSTTFRTHFDSTENSRRWWLYNGSPIALFLVQLVVHYYNEATFWTLLGYLAIYHFAKQQYGLMMLAKLRAKDFGFMTRDKWLLFSGAIFPIALWHCDSTRKFDWFNRDDPFLLGLALPELLTTPIFGLPLRCFDVLVAGYVAAFALLVRSAAKQYSDASRPFPTLKFLIIFYSWISWAVGVLVNHKVIALSFLNLFHAVPAYIIVFCSTRNRWWVVRTASNIDADDAASSSAAGGSVKSRSTAGTSLVDSFGRFMTKSRGMLPLYLAFLMLCGVVEEFLWEAWVWQDYSAPLWEWDPQRDFTPLGYSAACSLLILPQSTHYFLDAYIWKMGKNDDGSEQNPHLKKYLALQL